MNPAVPTLPLPGLPTLPQLPQALTPMQVNPAAMALPLGVGAPGLPGLPPVPGGPVAMAPPAPVAAPALRRAPASSAPVSLEAAGFLSVGEPIVPRIILSLQASEKCGKTHFSLETVPGHVAVISFDTGTKSVLEGMRQRQPHKRYHLLQFKPPKSMVAKGEMTQQDAIEEWDRLKAALRAVFADKSIRSLAIDTASEMWELCRLAILGKLEKIPPLKYVEANNEFREWIKEISDDIPGLNLILAHKVKPEYAASANGMGNKTGKFERQGMGDVPFLSDVNGENIKWEDPTGAQPGAKFGFKVYNSRLNAGAVGGLIIWNDQCTFETLGMYCFPETAGTEYWRRLGR